MRDPDLLQFMNQPAGICHIGFYRIIEISWLMEKSDGTRLFFYRLLIEVPDNSYNIDHLSAASQNISNGVFRIFKPKICQGRFINDEVGGIFSHGFTKAFARNEA